jgi:hypothetical protein
VLIRLTRRAYSDLLARREERCGFFGVISAAGTVLAGLPCRDRNTKYYAVAKTTIRERNSARALAEIFRTEEARQRILKAADVYEKTAAQTAAAIQ